MFKDIEFGLVLRILAVVAVYLMRQRPGILKSQYFMLLRFYLQVDQSFCFISYVVVPAVDQVMRSAKAAFQFQTF